ncbi:MAG: YcaO-like family protein [Thermodesulfobacteriota bacterium]|nr:YcaO-like family protein [Thermodesulfobacteriota bacterium]
MTNKIVLKNAYKGSTLYQDKIISPEETVFRFQERLREVDLDILESTRRIDNGRLDIPVYFSICGKDATEVIGAKKQMGKGATPDQSEASAVMELAERFSFFSFSKDPGKFLVEEYRNIKDPVLPFEAIALSVHDDSDDLDKAREVFSSLPLKWTWAYNLTREEEVLIPFDWFFAINEFNGPSAGNCVEEALIQGICEVVERHVSSIISQNKLGAPAISRASITDPVALEMIGKYEKAGVRLLVSDFSLNTGIPSLGALAYDPSTFPQRSEIVWTAGTTPNPQKALNRALTEVAQLAGDFNTGSNYVASGLPKFRTLAEADFVLRADREVDISELPDLSHDNIRVEVENCVSALSEIGMEVIVVNVTHPILQIPAFYTIVPGAHFRERAQGTSVAMFSAKLIAEGENPERAISELQKMDHLMPGKYFVKFYLGSCHLSMNEPREALRNFQEALDLNPKEEDTASIYSYMGVCLKDLGQYRQAISALEKAEGYDNERTDIYNLMGFCYFKLKEHDNAIECFQQVLGLDPSSAIDYANIASNYRDMGKIDLAIQHYELALDLDPSIEFARDNLARLQRS